MLVNLRVKGVVNNAVDSALTIEAGLSIKCFVKEESVPIPCRIRLFEKSTGRIVKDQVTDITGFVSFTHLNLVKYFAIAHHPANENFNALIFDNLFPK